VAPICTYITDDCREDITLQNLYCNDLSVIKYRKNYVPHCTTIRVWQELFRKVIYISVASSGIRN
jgi:hypothetical protein